MSSIFSQTLTPGVIHADAFLSPKEIEQEYSRSIAEYRESQANQIVVRIIPSGRVVAETGAYVERDIQPVMHPHSKAYLWSLASRRSVVALTRNELALFTGKSIPTVIRWSRDKAFAPPLPYYRSTDQDKNSKSRVMYSLRHNLIF